MTAPSTSDGQHLSNLIHLAGGVEVLPPKPVDLRAAALYYARRYRWPVFPLRSRGKEPLTSRGFKDATTLTPLIEFWWGRWPDANIGVPTGLLSEGGCGFDVIDLDGEAGIASFAMLAPVDVPTPTAIAFTPGDPARDRAPGRHHYLRATGDGNATKLLPGVDYRGVGGFVVVPPSLGPHGVGYAWIQRPEEIA